MGENNVKKLYIILGVIAIVIVVISSIWITAYNTYQSNDVEVSQKRGDVHATLSIRYDKMAAMIDTIQSANSTVQGYLDTIMDARAAFANALASNDLESIDESIQEINSTFINLVSYVEDNPSSYNTTALYANALAEFNASTNVVLTTILAYNDTVATYNKHIRMFPNNLFVGNNPQYDTYEVANFNKTLPSFND